MQKDIEMKSKQEKLEQLLKLYVGNDKIRQEQLEQTIDDAIPVIREHFRSHNRMYNALGSAFASTIHNVESRNDLSISDMRALKIFILELSQLKHEDESHLALLFTDLDKDNVMFDKLCDSYRNLLKFTKLKTKKQDK